VVFPAAFDINYPIPHVHPAHLSPSKSSLLKVSVSLQAAVA
jgi:hypothetical protein